jgi:hypothetical protein
MTRADLVASVAKDARTRANGLEQELCNLIQVAGHIPIAIGWPDIAVFAADGTLRALIEVKPNAGRCLKAQQELMLRGLAAFGVRVSDGLQAEIS